jgi:hypothetical protein
MSAALKPIGSGLAIAFGNGVFNAILREIISAAYLPVL